MPGCGQPAPSPSCCLPMPEKIDVCPSLPVKPKDKYVSEVGTTMLGNHLIIRREKDKSKHKKKGRWEPPCDCDVIVIKRPTDTRGPRIVNGGDNNQIVFRIHSKAHLKKKVDPYYRPQAIVYKIDQDGTEDGANKRNITIHPQLGGPVYQEVHTARASEDNHDVYLLRVKKKNELSEVYKSRNVEVELRTPKLKKQSVQASSKASVKRDKTNVND